MLDEMTRYFWYNIFHGRVFVNTRNSPDRFIRDLREKACVDPNELDQYAKA